MGTPPEDHIPGDTQPETTPPSGETILDDLAEQLERTRRLLTSNPGSVAEEALSRFSGDTEVEARIAVNLASTGPLSDPERFLEAHRLALRALEILDREGSRTAAMPRRLGPLRPLFGTLVGFVVRYIVKSFSASTVSTLQRLYTRREPQAPRQTIERSLLTQARVEVDRVAPGFEGGGAGLPVLVVGGAAVPALASASQYLGAIDFLARPVLFGLFVALFILFGVLSWVLLTGASVAHRRAELFMRQPLAALWVTVGHCGEPPTDYSRLFASVAVLLSAVVWVVIPVSGVVVYLVT
jgi:hypothetical protein